MRYEEFDDYEYSRDSGRRGGYSGSRDFERASYREPDRGYDRRDSDYDRYDSRDDGYDRYGSRNRYDSYDRYAGSDRGTRFDGFDPYNWERTAPNWDRDRDRRSSTRKRRSGEQSERSSRSGSYTRDYERRERRETREYRESRDRRPSRDSRERSGGSTGRSRRTAELQRQKENRRRHPRESVAIPKLVPIAIGVILLIIIALLVKNIVFSGPKSDYSVTFGSDTIVVGETTKATVVGLPDGSKAEVNWISGDTSVVTITESEGVSCTLTAKDEGTATIAATVMPEGGGEEISISGTIEVVKTAPGVLGITMAEQTATVYSGEQYTIGATVEMEDGYAPAKISWSSNDASVARVDENGMVSARDVGTAIITATAGEKTAEIVITVVENPNGTPPDESQIEGQASDESVTGTSTATGDSGSTGSATGTGTSASTGNSSSTGGSSSSTSGSSSSAGGSSNSTGSSSSSAGGSSSSTGGSSSSTGGSSSTSGSSSSTGSSSADSSELSGSITGTSPAE